MSTEKLQLKREFMRDVLSKGWDNSKKIDPHWYEVAGQGQIERWMRHLNAGVKTPQIARHGTRLVNGFSIGADPELVFVGQHGMRVDANNLGLKAGLAFGADNNGRLAEIRPAPHRSALHVLASIWATAYWMAIYTPDTLTTRWRAGSFAFNDGIGGHIHIGRRGEINRAEQIAALDRLAHLLFTAGCFNIQEGRQRVRDAQGGRYGRLGDIRLQPHGWEYRTFPSWLDSPHLSFLSLTTAKLAVWSADAPRLLPEDDRLTAEDAKNQIRLLLSCFRGIDDDARLALAILQRHGFPRQDPMLDLKAAWGIFPNVFQPGLAGIPTVIPEQVPATEKMVTELGNALLEGRVPEVESIKPSWNPQNLPEHYYQWIQALASTRLTPGIGEFMSGLCYNHNALIEFASLPDHADQLVLQISSSITKDPRWKEPQRAIQELGFALSFANNTSHYAFRLAPNHGNITTLLRLRDIMVRSGIWPLWFMSEVKPDSYEKWLAATKTAPKDLGDGSKVLYT